MRVTMATRIGNGWTYATVAMSREELIRRLIADHRMRRGREEQLDGEPYKGDAELLQIGDEVVQLVAGLEGEYREAAKEARRIILEGGERL